ncbi:mating-type protein [Talaromyces pinophilus]|uniref:Mating-type protein n=2 Tax=Talaromyces pinophilus TaxID=128442 RepID=A0A6V8HQ75_TALPI|nr:mating-type protein [Talaromyces pinophilus]
MATGYYALDDLNPLQKAFQLFLLGLPSSDLDNLLSFVRDSDEEQRPSFTTEFMRQTTDVITALAAEDQIPSSPESPTESIEKKKLRPLNSFMAYRSFYSTMFPEMTQKTKSGIIKDLWQADPYKGKWAILAKAYSLLRDDHRNEVSLDSFLELTVPFIGLIQPEDYLEIMGCRLVTTDGQYHIENVSPARPDLSESATNLSVGDVLQHCYENGYVEVDDVQHTTQSETTSQLLFAAQPNSSIRTDQGDIVLDNVNQVMQYMQPVQNAAEQPQISTSALLGVRVPMLTQGDLLKNIHIKVADLRQHNNGDPDLYAPFNPTVQGFPTYDPMAHDPFDAFNITDMPY